jgi:hypothetical protein
MEEKEAITRAVLDYVEGWYQADGARMERALHPDLAKRGFSPEGDIWNVDKSWMVEAAGRGQGRMEKPETGKKEIRILDIGKTIASVKLVSEKFIDYLHLARNGGEWKIVNALWEYH